MRLARYHRAANRADLTPRHGCPPDRAACALQVGSRGVDGNTVGGRRRYRPCDDHGRRQGRRPQPHACSGVRDEDHREAETKSIQFTPTTVPDTVRNLRQEEYLIETESPPYQERTDTHVKRADSQACPLKGGESSETSTFDVRGHSVGLPDTAILIESLTGGKPSRELKVSWSPRHP